MEIPNEESIFCKRGHSDFITLLLRTQNNYSWTTSVYTTTTALSSRVFLDLDYFHAGEKYFYNVRPEVYF